MTDPKSTPDAPAPDLLAGVKLQDNQCVVALDEGGTGWLLARSENYRNTDVLPECSAEDNGFNRTWDKGLSAGVYLLTLRPWSDRGYEGDWDAGVDVVAAQPLWTIAALRAERDEAQPVANETVAGDIEYLRWLSECGSLSLKQRGKARQIAERLTTLYAHPPATSPGASGCEHLALPGAKCVHCWRKEWATSPGAAGDADEPNCEACNGLGVRAGPDGWDVNCTACGGHGRAPAKAPAAAEVDRVRWLLAAMREAKSLLSYASQDSVDPAIGQANKNRAWHVLNEALRSAAP